jgi:hypothetical protein
MIFTVLGAVAELEPSLICERVRAGLRNAKAKGKRLGRPRGRSGCIFLAFYSMIPSGVSIELNPTPGKGLIFTIKSVLGSHRRQPGMPSGRKRSRPATCKYNKLNSPRVK